MKIVYTKHAGKKFKDLKALHVNLSKRRINKIIKNPAHLDETSDPPKKIASGEFGKKHILRVVYRFERGIIVVITFYPAKKGRYFTQ